MKIYYCEACGCAEFPVKGAFVKECPKCRVRNRVAWVEGTAEEIAEFCTERSIDIKLEAK